MRRRRHLPNNDRALIRLAASVVIEQNDEWLVGRRYLSNHWLEAVLDQEKKEDKTERRPASSRRPEQPMNVPTSYTTSWDLTRPAAIEGRDINLWAAGQGIVVARSS